MKDLLLSVSDLRIHTSDNQTRVENVSFKLATGGRLGIIGASGSGKSLTAWSLFGIPPVGGHITGQISYYNEKGEATDILHAPSARLRAVTSREISLVPQNPFTSLNPAIRCGEQVLDALRFERSPMAERKARVIQRLTELHFDNPERVFNAFPVELSGGELQRVVIAMATVGGPRLLVADEPTSALDASTQHGIVKVLDTWCTEHACALIFISHNLHVVNALCNDYLLIQDGRLVGSGKVADFTRNIAVGTDSHAYANRSDVRKHNLLVLDHVSKTYVDRTRQKVHAVRDVSFSIETGECVGLVGRTGCGKSTIARITTGLTVPDIGLGKFRDQILDYSVNPRLRGEIQMIFQDPYSALYPHRTVSYTLREPLRMHRKLSKRECPEAVAELLTSVGLPLEVADRYPWQLSGGERQRVQIARALAAKPSLLICDECVANLDLAVQGRILELLRDLRKSNRLTILFISHDLAVVRFIADRILVMEEGMIVESGAVEQIFSQPGHSATRNLMQAIIAANT